MKMSMQPYIIRSQTDHDGLLRVELATDLSDQLVEIVMVVSPITTLTDEVADAFGYPAGYFDATFGSFADEPLVRE